MAFYKLGTREGGVNPTGNAVEANVLKDKTFSNASGINKIGTMPDNSTTTSNGTVPGINSSYPNIPIRPGSNLQMGVNTDGVKQLAIEPPQGYYPGGGSSYIGVDADDLGDAVASDVVSGKTFTSKSGIEVVGTMPNNGAVSPTALSPNGSYTIPKGYHNGNGVVTASPNTGTYSPTTRNAALDMGIDNLNRYVNTTGVPNSNSGTYTFPANDTGGTKDLGVTNTYRYVNATNVYNKGKADGVTAGSYRYAINWSNYTVSHCAVVDLATGKRVTAGGLSVTIDNITITANNLGQGSIANFNTAVDAMNCYNGKTVTNSTSITLRYDGNDNWFIVFKKH